jgi:hypothetical protein
MISSESRMSKTPLIDEIKKIAAEEERSTKPYSDDEIYRRLEPIVQKTRAIAEDETDENGLHPLMYASAYHLPNVIRVLYKFSGITWRGTRDPNVNYEDKRGCNALLYALNSEYDEKRESRVLRRFQETLDLLLEHGANPWQKTKTEKCPVTLACRKQNIYFIKKMPKTTEFNLSHAVTAAESKNPDIFPYLMDKYKHCWNYDRSKKFGKYYDGKPDFDLSEVNNAKKQITWLSGIFDRIATSDPATIKKVIDYFIKVKNVLAVPIVYWSKNTYELEHVDISLIMLALIAWSNREPLNHQDNTLEVIKQHFVPYIKNDCLQYAVMQGHIEILRKCHQWNVTMTGPMEFGDNSFGNAGLWHCHCNNKIMLKSLLEAAVVSVVNARDMIAYLIEIGSSQTVEAMKIANSSLVMFPQLREGKKELIIQGLSLGYFNDKFPDDIAAFCLAIKSVKNKELNLSSVLKSLSTEDKDDLRKYFRDDQESLNAIDRALGKEGTPAVIVVTTAVLPPPSAPMFESQADFKTDKMKASCLSVSINPASEGLSPPAYVPEKNESAASFSTQIQGLLDLLLVNNSQLKSELIPIVGNELIVFGCMLMPEVVEGKATPIELSIIISTLKDVVTMLRTAEGNNRLRPSLFSMAGRELKKAGENLLKNESLSKKF